MKHISLLLFTLCIQLIKLCPPHTLHAQTGKQNGICYVAWNEGQYATADADWSLEQLAETGANWIRLRVQYIQDTYTDTVIYKKPDGPLDEDLVHVIQKARELGLKITLDCNVDLEADPEHWGGCIGDGFTTEAEWTAWFTAYKQYIWRYAEFAETHAIEQFLVGLEKAGTVHREQEWRDLIAGVRARYSGSLSYSACHFLVQDITWWDALDYIGVSAYFDLTDKYDPTVEELKAAWTPHIALLQGLHETWNMPVIFTEIGFATFDGYNADRWQTDLVIDLQEQADCFQAFFETVYGESWLEGVYIWCWLYDPFHGGPTDLEYSFHDKPSENVIRTWFGGPPWEPEDLTVTDSSFVYVIYDDVLEPSWQECSWYASVDLQNQDCVYSGESAIRTTLESWGALSLRTSTPLQTGYKDWLEFYVRASSGDPVFLRVFLVDDDETALRIRPVTGEGRYIEDGTIEADRWKPVRIPLTHLKAATTHISGIIIQECNSEVSTSFWIDRIRILGYRSQTPRFISPDSVTATEGDLFTYTARAVDPEDSTVHYSFHDYPDWLSPEGSVIAGRPPTGESCCSFTVAATDRETTAFMTVHVEIVPATFIDIPLTGQAVPDRFSLGRNYPNPFNTCTIIPVGLPRPAAIVLNLCDINGRVVKQIFSGLMQAGYHTVQLDAKELSSGIYIIDLQAEKYRKSIKVILLN